MALDHPYHTVYSLIALRNGNLGRNGLPLSDQRGGGQVIVKQEYDIDKVCGVSLICFHCVHHMNG